jgi:hypothetical protein
VRGEEPAQDTDPPGAEDTRAQGADRNRCHSSPARTWAREAVARREQGLDVRRPEAQQGPGGGHRAVGEGVTSLEARRAEVAGHRAQRAPDGRRGRAMDGHMGRAAPDGRREHARRAGAGPEASLPPRGRKAEARRRVV